MTLATEALIRTTRRSQQEALAQPAVVVSEGPLIAGLFEVMAELEAKLAVELVPVIELSFVRITVVIVSITGKLEGLIKELEQLAESCSAARIIEGKKVSSSSVVESELIVE